MQSFTLVLTRGTHVVSVDVGSAILDALARNAPTVCVDLDVLCDGFVRPGVVLATAHIIALVPNPAVADDPDALAAGSNVTVLHRVR